MKRRPVLLLSLAAATLLASCSAAAAPSPATSPSPATVALDGRTFLSTDVQGMTLVPGTRITLSFKDGSLQASGGCNTMGGAYSIAGDRLQATQLMMTEMACAEPRMQQDQWLAGYLGDVRVVQAGDTLTMDDGAVVLTLLDRKVATPDKPLVGTLWVVDGIVTGRSVSSVPEGTTASLRFADGKVEVNAGCNTGGGPVVVAADGVTFGPMISTNMACQPDAIAVERAFLTVLAGEVPYSIDADTLTLDAGANGLILRAAP